jgi:hypothetical protein
LSWARATPATISIARVIDAVNSTILFMRASLPGFG